MYGGVWRSPVARTVRDGEVAGSNPVTPTIIRIINLLLTVLIMERRPHRSPAYVPRRSRLSRWLLGGCGLVLASLLLACTIVGWPQVLRELSLRTERVLPTKPQFPAVDTAGLSPTRQAIIATARQEFNQQPRGTKYSQGIPEDWCADFVSWILREAGAPLQNPHSGSWRIPGTFTLREYYQSAGRFRPADGSYTPRPGDVAIYRGSPIFRDHTNIVLRMHDGVLTTVGGNEGNRIRVHVNHAKQYDGLLGYGVLAE